MLIHYSCSTWPDCWGPGLSHLTQTLWLTSINLITVGFVSVIPVVTHDLPCRLTQPLLFWRTSEAAAVGFLRATAQFETKPQMGFLRLLESLSSGETMPKRNPIQPPFSRTRFHQLVIICVHPQTESNFQILHTSWIIQQPLCVYINAALRRQTWSYVWSVFTDRPVSCHPAALLRNGRPRRRRLSPWKRCLT